ncbi:MAG: hypothetical protein ACR2OB_03720 [Solirubrobacteraceae bacterium]
MAAALAVVLPPAAGIARAVAVADRASGRAGTGGSSGWTRPFRIAGPVALDILPAQIGFSPTGAAAIAFGVNDADVPEIAVGFAALFAPSGQLRGPTQVPGASSILDLSFDRGGFALLSGSSPVPMRCCTSAQVISLTSAGSFRRARTIAGNLTGTVAGRLVALSGGRALAAIASASGVWVAQSSRGGRFAAPRLLAPAGAQTEALAATVLARGHRSVLAWTAAGAPGGLGPRRIFVATGSRAHAPRRGRAAVTVPRGHGVEELGLVPHRRMATVAWIESSYDRAGRYRSQAVVADLDRRRRARAFTVAGEDAAGLSVAADANGDQALAWKTCTRSARCTVRVAARRAGGPFGASRSPGTIDPAQTPVVALAPDGAVLVGWIRHGKVFASVAGSPGAGFTSPHRISAGNYAHELALAFGPKRAAIAAWTEGTRSPSLEGAVYELRGR